MIISHPTLESQTDPVTQWPASVVKLVCSRPMRHLFSKTQSESNWESHWHWPLATTYTYTPMHVYLRIYEYECVHTYTPWSYSHTLFHMLIFYHYDKYLRETTNWKTADFCFQRFQPMAGWLYSCGPKARMKHHVEGHDRGKLLTS